MPNLSIRCLGILLALLTGLAAGCGNTAKDLPPPPAGGAPEASAPAEKSPVAKQDDDDDQDGEGDADQDGDDAAGDDEAEKKPAPLPAVKAPAFKGEAAAATFAKGGVTYAISVPKNWTTEEPANNMRAFQASVPRHEQDTQGATLTLSLASGGVDANIKRYVGMFGGDESLKDKGTLKTDGGATATFADLEGAYTAPPFMGGGKIADAKMLIAIVPMGTQQMFIKLLGPRHTVDAHKAGFLHLVKSFAVK